MKKHTLFALLAFLVLMSVTSCSAIWIKKSHMLEEKANLKRLSNHEKTLVYLPLHHIGKKSYYQDILKKTDSLRDLEYDIMYEEVTTNLKNKADYTLLAKKFRKITGSFNAGNGYLDTINNKIGGIKYNKKYQLMNQPKAPQLGIDTINDINADVTIEKLITAFEKDHGVVVLDTCDMQTDLKKEYLCEPLSAKLQKTFRDNFILGLRDQNLAQQVNSSASKNIFVIYGASHYSGLLNELRKTDSSWYEMN